MLRAVADTHTVIWYIFADNRLAEIVYLSEKGRINPATLDRLLRAVEREDAGG